MKTIELVSMSTKGQVVIPKTIRDELGLVEDDRLLAMASDEGVLLQKVDVADARKKLVGFLDSFKKQFAEAGITEEDVKKEIGAVRSGSASP